MSGRDKQGGRNIGNPEKDERREREHDERQEHKDRVEIVRAIDRIPDQLAADEQKDNADESKRRVREWLTIFLLVATVVAAGWGDIIFYRTLATAHADNVAALAKAEAANKQAREFFRDGQIPILWYDDSEAFAKLDKPRWQQDGKDGRGVIVWNWTIRNYGTGVAFDVRRSTQMFINQAPCAPPTTPGPGTLVPPQGWTTTMVTCPGYRLTRDEFDQLSKQFWGIAIRDWDTYRDRFGGIWQTEYCNFMFGPDDQGVCAPTELKHLK